MDASVLAAMARWPNVPHVHGWLSLDRRGHWRLRDEAIRHAGFCQFIGRNYGNDAGGNWFFQNGPQRVYVRLEYTPWVVRLGEDALLRHTGDEFEAPAEAFIDEHGSLLLRNADDVALLDNRDLATALEHLYGGDGQPLCEARLAAMLAGEAVAATLNLGGHTLAVSPIRSNQVGRRFGFIAQPAPAD